MSGQIGVHPGTTTLVGPRLNDVYSEEFAVRVLPARTAIQVGALPFDARVELDVIAHVPAAEGN